METTIKEVVQEVKEVAKEVEAEVAKVAKAATIKLNAEDELFVRKLEVNFLKAMQETEKLAQQTQQLGRSMEAMRKQYQDTLKAYGEKYLDDAEKAASYVWDELQAAYRLVEKKA